MIQHYTDFCRELLAAGFSLGDKDAHIFSLFTNSWNEDGPMQWHTGNPDTDPWEWRMRVLQERSDIAYGKLFFKKSGYITQEFYPYFLAARRGGASFAQAYESGTISHYAKRIYDVVAEFGSLATDNIKREAGFTREEKSKFDSALTELQMRMYLTMQGQQQIGTWPSTVFCTTELFWDDTDVFERAAALGADEVAEAITQRVLALNPAAQAKKIAKFIFG
ncbi:MAG: hypothetical protein FWB76_02020 [Oscillospiraceae bacterium]|nr:hypothetical protein [Oscillospiraceae bacterium]